jgi:hypothetical protein
VAAAVVGAVGNVARAQDQVVPAAVPASAEVETQSAPMIKDAPAAPATAAPAVAAPAAPATAAPAVAAPAASTPTDAAAPAATAPAPVAAAGAAAPTAVAPVPATAASAAPLRPGASATDLVNEAAAAFDGGDVRTAIQLYEQAEAAGLVNGHLYYNLGIAYFRDGRVGDAVAAFLAARRFLPRDPDVDANLRFAVSGIHDRLETERDAGAAGRIGFFLAHVAARELAWATALLAALGGLLLAVSVRSQRLRPARQVAWGFVALAAACGAALGVKSSTVEQWGAVTAATGSVRSGPGERHPVMFALQPGAPFVVAEKSPLGYLRIELSDGKKGWIAASDVKVLGPRL